MRLLVVLSAQSQGWHRLLATPSDSMYRGLPAGEAGLSLRGPGPTPEHSSTLQWTLNASTRTSVPENVF